VEKEARSLQNLEASYENLDLLCNIMIITMAYYEIERFKIEKYQLYSEAMKKFTQMKTHQDLEVKAFFEFILQF